MSGILHQLWDRAYSFKAPDKTCAEAVEHIIRLRERNHELGVRNLDIERALLDAGLEFHYGPNGPTIARRQRDDVVHNQTQDT
jgi:hypothetical protein